MITKTVSNWLQRQGLEEAFLEPKYAGLSDWDLILDRDVVIDRIAMAIRSGEHVVVFGDYDVDGQGACTIMTEGIRALGGRVTPMLASRFSGGYGFSQIAAQCAKDAGAKLVITNDCGSSDHDRIAWLNSFGIDTCVIDHHLVPDKPLPARGFLNPHRPECKSTYKWLASVGLAFTVIAGLKKKLGASIDMLQWIDIVAMGTVADVAPLTGDNRILTRVGLKDLVRPKRPGLSALYQLTNFNPEDMLTGRDIGFRIAPAINAPGRMGPPDIILDLLMERDGSQAREVAEQVKALWDKRRDDTENLTEETVRHVEATDQHLASAIVVGHESWNHGIVGIVAARLVDKYNVPVCVLGEHGRGSLRGPPGSTLYDALCFCKETLVKYGGHQAAAGAQIAWENIEAFRTKFNEFFSKHPIQTPADSVSYLLELETSDDVLSVANDINKLEPCGQGNPRPVVSVTCQVKSAKAVKGNHLKLDLILSNGQPLSGFGINLGDLSLILRFGQRVTVTGDLRKSTWNGKTKAEIFISTVIQS